MFTPVPNFYDALTTANIQTVSDVRASILLGHDSDLNRTMVGTTKFGDALYLCGAIVLCPGDHVSDNDFNSRYRGDEIFSLVEGGISKAHINSFIDSGAVDNCNPLSDWYMDCNPYFEIEKAGEVDCMGGAIFDTIQFDGKTISVLGYGENA